MVGSDATSGTQNDTWNADGIPQPLKMPSNSLKTEEVRSADNFSLKETSRSARGYATAREAWRWVVVVGGGGGGGGVVVVVVVWW